MTPSGQLSGKEQIHQETQHARESPQGLQERVKRKAVEKPIVNAISSERSDPKESAHKYRRLNNSPSPSKLKEQVRLYTMFSA